MLTFFLNIIFLSVLKMPPVLCSDMSACEATVLRNELRANYCLVFLRLRWFALFFPKKRPSVLRSSSVANQGERGTNWVSRARARRDDAKRLGHSSLAAVAAAAPLDRFDLLRNGREQLHAGRKEGRRRENQLHLGRESGRSVAREVLIVGSSWHEE